MCDYVTGWIKLRGELFSLNKADRTKLLLEMQDHWSLINAHLGLTFPVFSLPLRIRCLVVAARSRAGSHRVWPTGARHVDKAARGRGRVRKLRVAAAGHKGGTAPTPPHGIWCGRWPPYSWPLLIGGVCLSVSVSRVPRFAKCTLSFTETRQFDARCAPYPYVKE
jgi:hypothetical protein